MANDINRLECDLDRMAAITRRFWKRPTEDTDYRQFVKVLQLLVAKMDTKVKEYQVTYGTTTAKASSFSKRIRRHTPASLRGVKSSDVPRAAEAIAARVESLRDDMLAIQGSVYAIMDAEENGI